MSHPQHITIAQLLALNCNKWHLQRTINKDVVKRYISQQRNIIQERGHPVILGDFILAQFPDKLYLIDGHHRYEMLRLLRKEIDTTVKVQIQIFACQTESEANRLYEMANDRYSINGNINAQGQVHIQGDKAILVVEQLKGRFNNFKYQNKTRTASKKLSAPYFDINDLLSQLNQNSELMKLNVEDIVTLIVNANSEYMLKLSLEQREKYKDGFYLCYGHTQCKWVTHLLK